MKITPELGKEACVYFSFMFLKLCEDVLHLFYFVLIL